MSTVQWRERGVYTPIDGDLLQDSFCLLRLALLNENIQLLHSDGEQLGGPVLRRQVLGCTAEFYKH